MGAGSWCAQDSAAGSAPGHPPRLRHTLFPAPQRPALGQMADGIRVSCRHRRRWARSCWRPSPELPNSTPPPPPPPPHPPLSQDSPEDTLRPYHHPRRVHSPSPLTLTTHSPDCVCTLLRPVWLSAVCPPPRCPDGPAFLRKISKPACLDCPPLTRCVDHGPLAWEGIYFIFPLGFISLGAIRSLPNLSPPIGASPGCLPSPIGFCRLRPDLNFGKMDSILEEEEARGEPRRVASCPELQTLDAPPGQTSFFLAVMPAGHCPI